MGREEIDEASVAIKGDEEERGGEESRWDGGAAMTLCFFSLLDCLLCHPILSF